MKNFVKYLILCIVLGSAIHQASAQEIAVIINSENPAANLSSAQVKITYMRKLTKRWKDLAKNIIPVDRNSDTEGRKKFLKEILGMTSDEFTRYFTERAYQNTEAPPVKFGSDAEIIAYVESNPGALAYVPKSSIGAGSKVKVVLTF